MKKILIVSDLFFPSIHIGAVRPSKIAKYLTKDGYEVDVFTRYPINEENRKICSEVYNYELVASQTIPEVVVNSKKNHGKLYKFLYRIKYALCDILYGFDMQKKFKEFVKVNGGKYDVIFSTFGPLGCLKCGLYYKKKFPNVKWICDFRDPALVDNIPAFKKIYLKHLEQKSCRLADAIVAVSNGYLDRICRNKFQNKSFMIPNGYDMDDREIVIKGKENSALKITYVGALYNGRRDISPLFKVLSELIEEDKINKNKIQFNYAGNDFSVIDEQAKKYELQDILNNCGVLQRKDCLNLQFDSDLLILANWNTKKEYGVFPGKLLEYMLIEKPIVAITMGDILMSEATQVINKGKLGISWEEANADHDYHLLKDYILNQYNSVINGYGVEFSPNSEVVERYNYVNIIKEIEEIIENVGK